VENMSNDEFNIENFINNTSKVTHPEWLNLSNITEMAIYKAICNQFSTIEALISSQNDLKLTVSQRKITAASVVREVGLKNRSSFTKERYDKLDGFMRDTNTRLFELWDIRRKVISKALSRPKKADVELEAERLSQKIDCLEARGDLSFIGELMEARRKFRFADLKRTIEEQQKRIDELELQNSELQLKLRDMLRPI
jgi:hypothetical protein